MAVKGHIRGTAGSPKSPVRPSERVSVMTRRRSSGAPPGETATAQPGTFKRHHWGVLIRYSQRRRRCGRHPQKRAIRDLGGYGIDRAELDGRRLAAGPSELDCLQAIEFDFLSVRPFAFGRPLLHLLIKSCGSQGPSMLSNDLPRKWNIPAKS